MVERPLRFFPVTLFASVMGVGGLALAWRRAARVWDLPTWPFTLLLGVAVLLFGALLSAYLLKWLRHPADAKTELRHPIRMAFVPTVTISLLVLATGLTELAPTAARVLWWLGAVGHMAATVTVLSAWFGRPDITMTHVTPAWFIPIVGNVITPLAAEQVGSVDLAWFAFGVGVVFWIGLLPVLLQRLLLHDPGLPPKLLPTLAIFVAPPAVILLSWQALTGDTTGPVSRIMYAATLVFLLLVAGQLPTLALRTALPRLHLSPCSRIDRRHRHGGRPPGHRLRPDRGWVVGAGNPDRRRCPRSRRQGCLAGSNLRT